MTAAARPAVLKGIALGVVSMALFAVLHSAVRELSDTMSAFQIVFWRMSLSVVMLMPWFAWKGFDRLRTRKFGLHVQRAAVNFGGMALWFGAIAVVPLAKAVAVHFTLPLFVLVMAAAFLHERVGPRRVAATAVGFAGMLIVLRPGSAEIGWPEAMILLSAALYAATVIYLKKMVATETPLAITFYTNVLICVFCMPPAAWFWVAPELEDVLPIAVVGVIGTLAPLLYTIGLRSADASIIAALDFLRLPFTAAIAFALFGEIPEVWVWIGAAVIVVSTSCITARESRLARARTGGGDGAA